jgi:hypothetical protein
MDESWGATVKHLLVQDVQLAADQQQQTILLC